jgi:hypothetical protein
MEHLRNNSWSQNMNQKKTLLLFLIILLSCMAVSCEATVSTRTPLEKLIIDVFDPQPGERVLIMVDLPHNDGADHPLWSERRSMAKDWHSAFRDLQDELDITVHPLLTFKATGGHNAPLPESATLENKEVQLEEILADTNIAVAMTEYSATAPLFAFTDRFPGLRVASMPGVAPAMMDTALAADYAELAQKCHLLGESFEQVTSATLTFSTGHELVIDLRNRDANVDDGLLTATKEGERVINLPSGEAYIAPYEGELSGKPSMTSGQVPIPAGSDSFTVLRIEQNRVVEVVGDGPAADELRKYFSVDDGRQNLAELGLGCNDMAVVTGNVLEDEKVFGVHIASGLSEHIGGTVGVDDFVSPDQAVHIDRVYPFGGGIEVTSLVFEYENGASKAIIQNGEYSLLD